jgi:hypothetical protein
MTEPRELAFLVPVDVLAEVNTAVTVLHWTSIPATIHVELGCDCSVSVRGRPRCFAARRPVSVLPPWTRRGRRPA